MDTITQLLTRGVDTIYPNYKTLEETLRSGKKLTIYQGFDPTGTKFHIGHAVGLRKMRQFQDLGHKVIFLIGDFTATIGDPSGKANARPQLTREEVLENAEHYKEQAAKILAFEGDNPVEILFNSAWLATLTFEDIVKLASHFSVQQMIERDMFQERIKRGDVIGLHEFFYPLMVGYDSVAMNVDLELGGSDQMFNMMAGRKLVSQLLGKEKFVLTVPLLTDSRGVKIGKTEGNVIGLTDNPNDFYGKIMALGDDAILPCFELLTDMPDTEIEVIKTEMEAGANPMAFKKRLAYELTKILHTDGEARDAENYFQTLFQKDSTKTTDIPELVLEKSTNGLVDILVNAGVTDSNAEAKRLIRQKGVTVNGTVVDATGDITLADNDIVKAGKKNFFKIKINQEDK